MTTIKPHELRPEHVNKRARALVGDAEVVGRIGPYQHEINWISDRAMGESDETYRPGPVQTAFSVGGIDLFATQLTKSAIELIEEN